MTLKKPPALSIAADSGRSTWPDDLPETWDNHFDPYDDYARVFVSGPTMIVKCQMEKRYEFLDPYVQFMEDLFSKTLPPSKEHNLRLNATVWDDQNFTLFSKPYLSCPRLDFDGVNSPHSVWIGMGTVDNQNIFLFRDGGSFREESLSGPMEHPVEETLSREDYQIYLRYAL